jgi:RHS repeat-associated protein
VLPLEGHIRICDRTEAFAGGSSSQHKADWAKRLTSITPTSGTGFGTSPVGRTYRLDGLLASQIWPNGETATLAYDTARRPTSISLTGGRSLTRSYDRLGNVTHDDRYLGAGVTGSAGDQELIHSYDALGRVTGTTLDGASIAAYSYDRDGNRLTKTDGGTTYTATYDRTDAQATQKIGAGTPVNLTYDASGNLTTEIRASGSTRAYTYDAANRLTLIDDPSGNDATLAYDPLDRLRTRTVGSDVQTQSYVGTSELAWRQAGAVSTTALVDAAGARVGSKSGASASWLLFDLLGSVAGLEGSAATTVTDAFRYDAYGQTIGRYPAGGSAVPVRFRGLLDIGPTADPDTAGAGSDPTYLMGDRVYSPHLGSFTALDTYAGDAQNPLSMNRFLYALGNPATLIDPSGHAVCEFDPCEDHPVPVSPYVPPPPPPTPSNNSGNTNGGNTNDDHTTDQQQVPSSERPRDDILTNLQTKAPSEDVDSNQNPCEEIEQVLAISHHCAPYRWNYTDDIEPVVVPVYSCVPFGPCVVLGSNILLQGKSPGPILPPDSGSAGDDLTSPAKRRSGAARGPTIPTIGGRQPINSKYAGAKFPLASDLSKRYPDGVSFKPNGFPDFGPYARETFISDNLTSNRAIDAAKANAAFRRTHTPVGYTWHHVEDGRTMILIPSDLHRAVRHTGGVAVLRQG